MIKTAAPLPIKLHCRARGRDLGRPSEVFWGLGTESFVFAVFFIKKCEHLPPPLLLLHQLQKFSTFSNGRRPLHALVFFRLSSKLICRCSQVVEFVEAFHCKFHTIVVTEFLAGENWFQRVKGATETLNEILRVMMKTLLSLQPMVASGQPLMYRPTRIIGNRLFLS